MARQVYTYRFFALQGLFGSVSYLVPAGIQAVIRDIDVYYGGGATPATWRLIGSNAQTIDFWNTGVLSQPGVHQWRGRQAVGPGESFTVSADAPMDVTVTGYQLAL